MKKHFASQLNIYGIFALTSLLPIMTISAHGREVERNQKSAKHQEMHQDNFQQQHSMHHDQVRGSMNHNQFENRQYENRALNNAYGGYGSYGNASSTVNTGPLTTPLPGSQPGMTDDSNALYHSYQQQQQPGH